ncbi:SDR family oxidoreductase [Fulvivirgaceae bacterium BMA10]|uniref:SDR family oxidoreductase n=1 Tax=Splendidivirga corallicola TaxID=3051826 RepID=A0ABT8KLE3_9BACT|nr:SDR family oxidoreductase [Fulvivirgaceae bacterium BMA10]
MFETKFHNKDLNNYTFLVTGGAGFIGSNIVEYLLKYQVGKVKVLDNLSNGFYKNIQEFEDHPSFEFIEGDIRDLETCINASKGCDYILHQAALGSVPRSINDPITSNAVNIDGFLNMLVAARDCKAKRFVYAASSSTYGDSQQLPKVENNIGRPLSPYAVTKYVNELYADVFEKTYGIDCVGLRYFNVFGPKQDPKGAYAAVIPLFIDAVLENRPPVINGDGEQTRDFTFVENAVEANIRAALADNISSQQKIYNIAYGERTSLNQLINILKEKTGAVFEATYGPPRVGDVRDSLASIEKAKEDFGYAPQKDIRHGLNVTLEWFKNNQEFIKVRA